MGAIMFSFVLFVSTCALGQEAAPVQQFIHKGHTSTITADDSTGAGTKIDKHSPVVVKTPGKVRGVAAGSMHSLIVLENGTLLATGWNAYGQLGDGTTVDKHSPVVVKTPGKVRGMAAGYGHSLFLLENGTVLATGWNFNGQLGDGTKIDRHSPIAVKTPGKVEGLAAGSMHSLIVLENGTVFATGRNAEGQLGDGTTVDKHSPVAVKTQGKVRGAVAGLDYSFFLLENGTLLATGCPLISEYESGQDPIQIPVTMKTPGKVRDVADGLMVLENGTLTATGFEVEGFEDYIPAVAVTTKVRGVEVGDMSSFILLENGTLLAHGMEFRDQLDDGPWVDIKHSPVVVNTPGRVRDMAAGDDGHCMIVLENGMLLAINGGKPDPIENSILDTIKATMTGRYDAVFFPICLFIYSCPNCLFGCLFGRQWEMPSIAALCASSDKQWPLILLILWDIVDWFLFFMWFGFGTSADQSVAFSEDVIMASMCSAIICFGAVLPCVACYFTRRSYVRIEVVIDMLEAFVVYYSQDMFQFDSSFGCLAVLNIAATIIDIIVLKGPEAIHILPSCISWTLAALGNVAVLHPFSACWQKTKYCEVDEGPGVLRPGMQIYRSGAFGFDSLTHHGVFIGKYNEDMRWDPEQPDSVIDTNGTPGNVKIRMVTLDQFCREKWRRSQKVFVRRYIRHSGGSSESSSDEDEGDGEDLRAVRRALAVKDKLFDYDLTAANCECFSYWVINDDSDLTDFDAAVSPQGCAFAWMSTFIGVLLAGASVAIVGHSSRVVEGVFFVISGTLAATFFAQAFGASVQWVTRVPWKDFDITDAIQEVASDLCFHPS